MLNMAQIIEIKLQRNEINIYLNEKSEYKEIIKVLKKSFCNFNFYTNFIFNFYV